MLGRCKGCRRLDELEVEAIVFARGCRFRHGERGAKVEPVFRFLGGTRRHSGGHSFDGGQRRGQVKWKVNKQVNGQAHGPGNRQANDRRRCTGAQGFSGLHDGGADVAAHRTCLDGGDPVGEVIQRLRAEVLQRRVDARVLGQSCVVELLAGPGSLTKVAQADHA